MKAANTIGGDKYFHAKGNYEAASRGTGGRHAASLIRYYSGLQGLDMYLSFDILKLNIYSAIGGHFYGDLYITDEIL